MGARGFWATYTWEHIAAQHGLELDGERIIGRKTLELMHSNTVPGALLPLEIGGLPLPGYGFGLGSRVLMDVAQNLEAAGLFQIGDYDCTGTRQPCCH